MNDSKDSSAGVRVLLVDDDEILRRALTRGLERAGFDVTQAPDGAGALSCTDRASFDVLVSDLQMPQLNGAQLVRLLRARRLYFPVILMSGSSYLDREAALYAGAAAFLNKPFLVDDLVSEVRAVLERPVTLAPPRPQDPSQPAVANAQPAATRKNPGRL